MPENTLSTLVPFPKGLQTLERDILFGRGQMIAPIGTVTDAIVLDVTCTVSASAATVALTPAQRLAVLSIFSARFTQYLADDGTLEPLQGVTLDRVRQAALRLLELDVEGLDDATGGLARPFAVGNNTVTFRAFLPVGALAKVKEGALFTGLSPEQLLDCELAVTKSDADPFKTAAAALTLGTVKVLASPGTKKAEARRLGVMPYLRRVTDAGNDTIKTPEGLVLDLSDESPLGGTQLGSLTVKVGGVVVTDDPSTPAKVYADYLRKYPGVSAAERTLTEALTPVYLASPGNLTRFYSGAVTARQKEKTKEWAGRVLYIPLLTHAEVMGQIRNYAGRMEKGRQVKAVVTGMYERLELDDRLLPYTGITLFADNEEGFSDFAGIFCEQGGEPYVDVPEHLQRHAALRVADAMRATSQYPMGNKRLVRSIILDLCRWVPAAITHPDGFRVASKVRQDVTLRVRDACLALDPALASAF